MKTKKLFIAATLALGMFAISATPANKAVQCGVSNDEIAAYLINGPHHHTVYSVSDIPGTCNSSAAIENCGTATVYVQDGAIIGHMDASGRCSGSIDKPAQVDANSLCMN